MNHHENVSPCPLCIEKLDQADERLQHWFIEVFEIYPRLHISWSYRGPEDQAKAVKEGKSKLEYPNSPHNHMEEGRPASLALDLFQLIDRVAVFDDLLYQRINQYNLDVKNPIKWGGKFNGLHDCDHFELIQPLKLV